MTMRKAWTAPLAGQAHHLDIPFNTPVPSACEALTFLDLVVDCFWEEGRPRPRADLVNQCRKHVSLESSALARPGKGLMGL